MLKKTGSKKGFTLAELLIVVAIIAVLTAIAVPLFVGALNDAEDKVKQANIAAVREAGVAEILTHYNDKDETGAYKYHLTGADQKGWKVVAKISSTGEIVGNIVVTKGAESDITDGTTQKMAGLCKEVESTSATNGEKYEVSVWITAEAVTPPTT